MTDLPTGTKEPGMKLGRPRDKDAHRKILEATLELMRSQSGRDITIEGIAREAGVSKVTIYRWWESKALLVIDAFVEAHIVRTPMQQSLPAGERIARHFLSLVEQYSGWPGKIVSQIIAEGLYDPEILRQFRERFHYGRRAVVREVLEDWRKSGDIRSDIDNEALMDLIYAPVYMRLLLGHAPLDKAFALNHLKSVYKLLGAPLPDFLESV